MSRVYIATQKAVSQARRAHRIGAVSLAALQLAMGPAVAKTVKIPAPGSVASPGTLGSPITPIQHVIVIIGENRTFDHIFATYKPVPGQSVSNLLSREIITLDKNFNAIPGPNYAQAQQLAAKDTGPKNSFVLTPPPNKYPGNRLPPPLTGGAQGPEGYFTPSAACYTATGAAAVACQKEGEAIAEATENGLPADSATDSTDANGLTYYQSAAAGGTLQSGAVPDLRITKVNKLPAGPFQYTNSTVPSTNTGFAYTDYHASPVHRFYQMWQQLDCGTSKASTANPSGCDGKLFSWVEVTVGAGTNGVPQPKPFTHESTGEGSTSLAFFNVQQGDAPYFTSLANNYAMSDNFHQSVNGGTGANHIMFGHADAIWFSDGNGNPQVPPNGYPVYTGTPDEGVVSEIENPNPARGTNNWYKEDGYGGGGYGSPVYGGGSYTSCADTAQPGVSPITNYLASININANCVAGHYYLLNNYNPGYFGNGSNAYTDNNVNNTPFTIPPSSTPSIGDDLNSGNISWKYYGDQWNNYVNDPYQLNYGIAGPTSDNYCTICNPFQYDTSIMSNPAQVAGHLQDTLDLYADISNGNLPAVSVVKPSGIVDGHPASSKLDLFEGFVRKIVDQVQASPYAQNTAIFITEDEGGGYYDSGYVQPLDFFGDGTRIPMIVVAPYLKSPGYISHAYTDHVSIDKFIERNWSLGPISNRSRDNFPNPTTTDSNPYVPTNSPALGDLFDFFNFPASPNKHAPRALSTAQAGQPAK